MKFFAGIVPPASIVNTIAKIQNRYGNNRLEPHITVRAPVIPVNLKAWVDTIEQAAQQFGPFEIELTPTGNFGHKTLYLGVQSNGLIRLYDELIPQLKLYEPPVPEERENYRPHLTLGRTWCGFTLDDFNAMSKLADEYVSAHKISFMAEFIRIYYKPDNQKGFQTYKDARLNQ